MLKIFLFCILLFASFFINAQNNTVAADKRVVDYFGKDQIELWQNTNSDSIRYYNFIVNSSFEVYTKEYIDMVRPENIMEAELSNSEIKALQNNIQQFNIFISSVPWKSNIDQWYKIGNTDLYMLIHNIEYLNNKFNAGK